MPGFLFLYFFSVTCNGLRMVNGAYPEGWHVKIELKWQIFMFYNMFIENYSYLCSVDKVTQ